MLFNFIHVVLLLASCYAVKGEKEAPSLTFIKRNIIEITTGQWLLAVEVPVEHISDSINEMSIKVNSFKEISENYMKNLTAILDLPENILVTDTFSSIDAELVELKERLDRIVTPVPVQRRARGYIDILGRGLHVLAGLATDEELEQVNNKVNFMAAKNK